MKNQMIKLQEMQRMIERMKNQMIKLREMQKMIERMKNEMSISFEE